MIFLSKFLILSYSFILQMYKRPLFFLNRHQGYLMNPLEILQHLSTPSYILQQLKTQFSFKSGP